MKASGEFEIGDRALYRGNFDRAKPQRCTITGIDEKDGRLAYECRLDNGEEHRGYVDQFSFARR